MDTPKMGNSSHKLNRNEVVMTHNMVGMQSIGNEYHTYNKWNNDGFEKAAHFGN